MRAQLRRGNEARGVLIGRYAPARAGCRRAALDRLLDPNNDAITLATLRKAAAVVGRQVRLELV